MKSKDSERAEDIKFRLVTVDLMLISEFGFYRFNWVAAANLSYRLKHGSATLHQLIHGHGIHIRESLIFTNHPPDKCVGAGSSARVNGPTW
jgi:hypothetical protein